MILLIDKPKGMTSHDVVNRVRQLTGEKRVGHGGTLDPNATGLLIVGVGRESTRELGKVGKGMDKTYLAEVRLGEERETDDAEGVVTLKAKGVLPPTKKELEVVLKSFLGEQMQTPPKYSAVKVGGRKAYELARKGESIKLQPRRVNIHQIKMSAYQYPLVKFEAIVSSGTYIRALARDVGRKLGTGAFLGELRRTQVGKYKIERAVGLDQLEKKFRATETV